MSKVIPAPAPTQEPPKTVEPVACRGRMIVREERHAGYQPENHEWRAWLCERDAKCKLIGKDPMTLPLDVLTASGHPSARTSAVIFRLRVAHGVATGEARGDSFLGLQPEDLPKRLTAIRETICLACTGENNLNAWEVRRCAVYDCPAWPFRMGHNPHNPQRGVNRFQKAVSPAEPCRQRFQTGGAAAPGTDLAPPCQTGTGQSASAPARQLASAPAASSTPTASDQEPEHG
ncbi:hypothetical protein G5V57_24165 [Nordella sp. HKS 07]|uniref:hypothetical protein n=1 Tax=Nordella sp. HKS 07 TaxID=2712222 RepID=UPI0013E1B8A4|nr:hypothetical protein [Nordella sp. HKS 07]QIG50550.1 hypothetical protein G5V57_24165 [Nordella sp. HKS 07]